MSDKKISFESKIPDHLLVNETPGMQYLMQELSKNTQATEYLLQKREESGEKLDQMTKELVEIRVQTQKTNGTVTKHTQEIAEIIKIQHEMEDIVAIKHFTQRWLFNKYALLFFGIFIVGVIKVATNDQLRELVMKIFGLG
jgi:hypothetical protein